MKVIGTLKAVAIVALGCGIALGAHASTSDSKNAPVSIDKATLAGKGLEPVPYPWPKDMLKSGVKEHKDLPVYAGQITASVYAPADGVLEFKDQPYDEVVHVLHGRSTLTPVGGAAQHFKTGDIFIVPKGFTGTWEMRDNYREFIVIETGAYNNAMAKWFPDMK